MAKNIYVTKPFLPALDDLHPLLEQIWGSAILTNYGALHQCLEFELAEYLNVPNISLFNNGTIALLTCLEALSLEGEVITSPFSFVATSHALKWARLTPVFADIDPVSMNLDPSAVERAITPRTKAILAVHCYGQPCDTLGLQEIANRHGLKLIYDAAHAFAVEDAGGSILRHGDFAAVSFHATKVFSTMEGGAVIAPTADAKSKIDLLRNFGIESETTVSAVGINGKMSEVHAAFGLLQLRSIDDALTARMRVAKRYFEGLAGLVGLQCCGQSGLKKANNSYFPVRVLKEFGHSRDAVYDRLRSRGIFSRRYFYPLISNLPMYRSLPSATSRNLPIATEVANQVLCLPIYPDLSAEEQEAIVEEIWEFSTENAI